MAQTTRLHLHYPVLSDAADANAAIQPLAEILDDAALWDQGTFASRPVSTPSVPGITGRFYYATDTGVLYFDTGTSWVAVTPGSGSITPAMIDPAWTLLPVGAIIEWPYAAAQIPAGWGMPYGQAIIRTDFPTLNALASAAGYVHGSGDGTTTFNLPDRRGRVGVGKDDMGGTAANRVTSAGSGLNGAALGATGGAQNVTLTTAQMPPHTHDVTVARVGGSGASAPSGGIGGTDNVTYTTTPAGSGSAHTNVQPALIVNYMIRLA